VAVVVVADRAAVAALDRPAAVLGRAAVAADGRAGACRP
jgi:hypothetical protein